MKNVLLNLALILCLTYTGKAQMNEVWKAEAGSKVEWNDFSPDGSLICGTKDNKTVAIDVATGKKVWEKPFDNGPFSVLPNTTYIYWQSDDIGILIIDPVKGTIVCDSKKLGIEDISVFYPVRAGNSFLMYSKMGDTEQLSMVDLNTGKLRWKRDFDFSKKVSAGAFSVSVAEDTAKMVLHCDPIGDGKGGVFVSFHERIMNIDKTGKTVWDIEFPSQFGDQDGFFKASGVDFKNIIPDKTGKSLYVFSGAYMSCHNRSDGKMAWEKPVKVFAPVKNIIFEEEGMTLIPTPNTASQKAYINSIDYKTGTPKYGENDLRVKGGFVQSSFCSKGLVYITKSFMAETFFFNIINTKTGTFELEKPIKLFKGPYQISEVKGGILISSNYGVNLYDYKTKTMVIDKQLKISGDGRIQRLDANGKSYLYSSTKGNIFTLNHVSLKVEQFNKEKIKLEGGDEVEGFTQFKDGIVMHSAQNVVKYDWEGNVIFQKYYKAPGAGAGAIMKASLGVIGGLAQMAAAAATAAAYSEMTDQAKGGMSSLDQEAARQASTGEMSSADYAKYQQDSKEMNQSLDEGKDLMNEQMAASAAMGLGNSAEAAGELGRISKRFKNSKATKNYVVLMTNDKEKGGIGLAVVSKIDGEIKGFLPMKQSRTGTSYNIDPVTNFLYWMPSMDSNAKTKKYPNIDEMEKKGTILSYDLNKL